MIHPNALGADDTFSTYDDVRSGYNPQTWEALIRLVDADCRYQLDFQPASGDELMSARFAYMRARRGDTGDCEHDFSLKRGNPKRDKPATWRPRICPKCGAQRMPFEDQPYDQGGHLHLPAVGVWFNANGYPLRVERP